MKTVYLILLSFLSFSAAAQKKTEPLPADLPVPTGYVNDYAHILSVKEIVQLEEKISAFDSSTSNQTAVVTVSSTAPFSIEIYSKNLFNKWGIGSKEKNNGILLLVAYKDRKVRITTGSGIASRLTDSICKQIIDDVIVPRFKSNEFYKGIDDAMTEIESALTGTNAGGEKQAEAYNTLAQSPGYSHDINPAAKGDNTGFLTAWIFGGIGLILLFAFRLFRSPQSWVSPGTRPADFYNTGYYNTQTHQNTSSDYSSYSAMSSSFNTGASSSDTASSTSGFSGGSSEGGGASGSW